MFLTDLLLWNNPNTETLVVRRQKKSKKTTGDITSDEYTAFINYEADWVEHFLASITIRKRIEFASEPFSITAIKAAINENFAGIETIDSIYAATDDQGIDVFVFLNNDHYDRDLMDILLDKEIKILDLYPDLDLDFQYIPLLGHQPEAFVPVSAKKIL